MSVSHKHVRVDQSACLPANLHTREGTHVSPTPLVKLVATPAGAVSQGERQMQPATQEDLERPTQSIVVALEVGTPVRAAEAKGPCWNLNEACCSSQSTPRRTRTLSPVVWWLSAASCPVVGCARVEEKGTTQINRSTANQPLPPALCTPGLESGSGSLLRMLDRGFGNEGGSLPHHPQLGKMGGSPEPLRA